MSSVDIRDCPCDINIVVLVVYVVPVVLKTRPHGNAFGCEPKGMAMGASPSRRGHEMHTAVVQKPAVWPSFGANFMTDSTIIAVFLCFCFGYFYVICIIAAHSRYERITGGDDAMYNVDNSFRKDVVTVVVLISQV